MVRDVVIVGGGIAGLACGVALTDAGLRVTLVERDKRLGGRARSWTDAASGDDIDLGPHVLHSEYRNMLALLERLGTRHLVSWQSDKLLQFSNGVVLRHRRLPPPLSLLPDLALQSGLSPRDLWSNNRPTVDAMRFNEADTPVLDSMSALDYLRDAGVTQAMIDWFWAFACLAVLNVPLERCSAAALLRVHSQLIGHRRIHFGFPAVALGDLFAPQAAKLIGRVLTGSEVIKMEPNAVVLQDGSRIGADRVVSTVPPQIEASPYVSCYLWFDRKLTRERFWAQLGAQTRLNTDFYDLSNIRRGWEKRPSVIASNIIYSHRAHAMTNEEIVAATQREIAAFVPEAAQARVVHAVVNRIPMVIPCPLPGSESARPAPCAALAGDWTRTGLPCSMESAACSGFIAAEEILQTRGIALPVRPADGLAGLVQRLRRRAAPGPGGRTLPTARPSPRP
ncbi:MAG TPA: FAD-dependent oxidoreductase [Burkholderiales bacterium]|jgi:15-cis-phytoene desaturase